MEQTLVLVKGDGVRRRLVGEIIRRIEAKGLDIADMKMMDVGRELAEVHYAEHSEKPFFEELVEFITATPVVAMRDKRRRRDKGHEDPYGGHEPCRRSAWYDPGRPGP